MERRITRLESEMIQTRTEVGAAKSDILELNGEMNDAQRDLGILRDRADRIEVAVRGLIAELIRLRRNTAVPSGRYQASSDEQVKAQRGPEEATADNKDSHSD